MQTGYPGTLVDVGIAGSHVVFFTVGEKRYGRTVGPPVYSSFPMLSLSVCRAPRKISSA